MFNVKVTKPNTIKLFKMFINIQENSNANNYGYP